MTAEEQRTVRLFQDNARSVVNVSTTRSLSPMFSPFMMQQQVRGPSLMPRGVGSGFVWDYDGHIITNAHVIAGAQEVTVTLCDGTVAKAKVVGGDREKDIAVLKVVELSQEQLASLRPVKLGSSSNLLVGQRVYAVGNPFGLDLALSQGIVSGLGREISAGGMWGGLGAATITNGIQTDTAMNPGNSGGPLLDSAGRVVGIATAILDPTGRGVSSGVGFAIPIDAVRGMVDQILRLGRVVRPALGITIAPVPQMMTRQPRWGMQAEQAPKAEGVLVVSVQPGGPADLAGVQPTRRELSGRLLLGDIITGINGRTVRTQKDLFAALDNSQVGDIAEVVVRSASGSTRTVRLTLADREKMTGSDLDNLGSILTQSQSQQEHAVYFDEAVLDAHPRPPLPLGSTRRCLRSACCRRAQRSNTVAAASPDPWGFYSNSPSSRPGPSSSAASSQASDSWARSQPSPAPRPSSAPPSSSATAATSAAAGPAAYNASEPWRPSASAFGSPPTSPSTEALIAELTAEEQRTVRLFQDNARSVVNVSTTRSLSPMFSPFMMQQQVRGPSLVSLAAELKRGLSTRHTLLCYSQHLVPAGQLAKRHVCWLAWLQMPRGVGSGFVWDYDGHIITNAHVIAGAQEVTVTLCDGTVAKAKVVGGDREKDIAVLKVVELSQEQLASLRPVKLGSSSNLLVGQRVYAVGNPFGLDLALSQGIVSGLGREISAGGMWGGLGAATITNGIQTDTAMNPGNSGGPLLDSAGRVVGIATAILDPTGRGVSSGVGFAIPIDAVRGMVDQILRLGRVVRPALGITIAPVPQMMTRQPRWGMQAEQAPKAEGVLVVSVQPGGPADLAGVQPTRRELSGRLLLGDIITGINGRTVRTQKDLFAALDNSQVGDIAEVVVRSASGSTRTVRLTLADREKMTGSDLDNLGSILTQSQSQQEHAVYFDEAVLDAHPRPPLPLGSTRRCLRSACCRRAQRSNTVAAASPDPWGFYSNSPSSRPGPSSSAASSQASDSWARSQPSPAPRPSSAPPSSSATAATSAAAGPAAYNASEPWRPSASAFGSPPTSPSTEALIAELTAEEQRTVRLFQDNARSVVNVSTTRSLSPMFSPFMMQQQVRGPSLVSLAAELKRGLSTRHTLLCYSQHLVPAGQLAKRHVCWLAWLQMPRGVGSGFVWDYDGHIITNAHVIAGAQEVTVTLCDGTVAKAKVVGGDREKDIAVLKVVELSQEQLASLRPVKLGSSSNLLVGQRVYAVGNPFGLDLALSQGIVSGLGREISAGGMWGGLGAATITNGIQTDTAMNPGNSGGPLLDSAGRVVGIATAILDPTGRGVSSGVGFAIPIDAVRGMVDQILRLGRVVRPALGITIAPVPQMMTRQPRWGMQAEQAPKAEGVLVVSVQPGGPADLAGVQPTRRELSGRLLLGDIITGINGRTVRTQKDLFAALDNSQVGDIAEVVVRSASGSTRTVRLTLADREKMTGSDLDNLGSILTQSQSQQEHAVYFDEAVLDAHPRPPLPLGSTRRCLRSACCRRAQRSNTVAAASPDPWGFYSNSPSSRPGPSSSAASSQASDSWARSQPSPAPRPSSAPPSSSATAATSAAAGPAAYNASEPWRPSASAFGSPPTSPSTEALIAELTAEEQRTVRLFQDNARSVVNVSTTRSLSPMFSPFMMQQQVRGPSLVSLAAELKRGLSTRHTLLCYSQHLVPAGQLAKRHVCWLAWLQMPRGVGSGFVWDYDGHIITNAHVIAGAQEVTVTLCDGTVAKAKVVGGDREKDIAVLKVVELSQEQLASLRPVKLGSSSNLLVGQRVYAVGNPFGLDLALSQGIVSGLGREISAGGMWGGLGAATITNGIQTDTAMNPGNSGGPLLDSAGRVVGIATAILDPTGRGVSSGVGFAIPIDAVRGMVDQILRLGRVVRPALGITIAPAEGVLVVSVQPGGPADLAGVQPTRRELSGRLLLGDIITGINGRTVRTQKDLFAALDNSQVGDIAEVVVRSASGSTRTVRLTLADREKMTGSDVITSDCEVEEEDCEIEEVDCGDDMSIGQFNLLPPIDIATARLAAARINDGEVASKEVMAALRLFLRKRPVTVEERCSHLYECYMKMPKVLCMVLCTLATGYRKSKDGGECNADSLRQRIFSLARTVRGEHHRVKISENDMAPILPMSRHAAAAPAAYGGPPPTPGPGSWPMSGHAAEAPLAYGGPPPTPGPGSWPMSGHAAEAPAAPGRSLAMEVKWLERWGRRWVGFEGDPRLP
ncbi:hypothetical protein QJQ45_026933, partial [Haematococcus lacustris]